MTLRLALAAVASVSIVQPVKAQNRPEGDRSDPSVIRDDRRIEDRESSAPQVPMVPPSRAAVVAQASRDAVASAILVQGSRVIPAVSFAPVIEPFLNRPLSHSDLVALATAVAQVARRAGFGLATAWVPEQELRQGVLRVVVDEGRIDALRVTGPAARYVERQLASLANGEPLRTDALERRLLLAGDGAGLRIGDARMVREGDRNILTLSTRYERFEAKVALDNWGSSPVGPVRAWVEGSANGVLQTGDALTLGVAVTPVEPQTFQLVEVGYRTPVAAGGTTLAVGGYYGRTDVSATEQQNAYSGESWGLNLDVSHALVRSRSRSLWLTGRFELRDSQLERFGLSTRDDRIAAISASLFGTTRFASGRSRARLTLTQGLDILDASRLGDPLASRRDASGEFTKLEMWASHWSRLGLGFVLDVSARAQISDGPLLSSEEMGLGGPQFVRAFNYRELSGDQGLAAAVELRFDVQRLARDLKNVWIYGYADGGEVGNDGGRGRSGTLASAGGGVRVGLARSVEAGLELGIPLTEGATDPNPPPRVSFTISSGF